MFQTDNSQHGKDQFVLYTQWHLQRGRAGDVPGKQSPLPCQTETHAFDEWSHFVAAMMSG